MVVLVQHVGTRASFGDWSQFGYHVWYIRSWSWFNTPCVPWRNGIYTYIIMKHTYMQSESAIFGAREWIPTRHIHEAVWTACCSGFYLSPRSIIRMKQCTRHSFGSKYLKLHSLKVTREFTVHVTLIDKIRLCDHCTLCWKVDGSWKVKSTLSSFSRIIHICGGRREQNVDIYERCGVKRVKHQVAMDLYCQSSVSDVKSMARGSTTLPAQLFNGYRDYLKKLKLGGDTSKMHMLATLPKRQLEKQTKVARNFNKY